MHFISRPIIIAAVATCLVSAANIGQADEQAVRITDSKLSATHYGIRSLTHWVDKMQPGDSRRGAALLRDHGKLETRFNRIPASNADQYIYISNQMKNLKDSIIAKADGKPTATKTQTSNQSTADTPPRGLSSLSSRLKGLEQDVLGYATAPDRQKSRMRSDLNTLQAAFKRIPKSAHPNYSAVANRMDAVAKAIQPATPVNMSRQQMTEFANSMQPKYGEQLELPRARDLMKSRELTVTDVDFLLARLKAFKENAARDLPTLKQIHAATGQGKYWMEWLESKGMENFQREWKSISTAIDNNIQFGLKNAKNRSELDAKTSRYAFTNPSVVKKNEELFARTLRSIEQAARLEQELGLPKKWAPLQAEMQTFVAGYRDKVADASEVKELPKEVGTKNQHKIAKTLFASQKDKYGIGKIIHTVVNTKTMPRDRIEHKEFDGKLETIVRKWDEYQVTTIEADNDGRLYVYRNMLAKFSRAPRTTPIGEWIITKRFKSGSIEEATLKSTMK